ncbi:MAG TPA: SRPBCC family protein [Verrucomicrobiae bacterium]|jgi:activator of HSP90 ATPase
MKTKNIEHTILIRATPKDIYDALMDEKKHSKFTGAPAKIRPKVGATFSCYGDYVTGVNVELKPGTRIVQAWRSQGWPEGYYSIVTFTLSKKSASRTKLRFTQIGIPAGDYAKKNRGWYEHYWEPLKKFLER